MPYNKYHNVHVDCESSDGMTRHNDDTDSLYVFGNEDLALENLALDCESSDGMTRYNHIADERPEPIQGTDINSPAIGTKRHTRMLYSISKVLA